MKKITSTKLNSQKLERLKQSFQVGQKAVRKAESYVSEKGADLVLDSKGVPVSSPDMKKAQAYLAEQAARVSSQKFAEQKAARLVGEV